MINYLSVHKQSVHQHWECLCTDSYTEILFTGVSAYKLWTIFEFTFDTILGGPSRPILVFRIKSLISNTSRPRPTGTGGTRPGPVSCRLNSRRPRPRAGVVLFNFVRLGGGGVGQPRAIFHWLLRVRLILRKQPPSPTITGDAHGGHKLHPDRGPLFYQPVCPWPCPLRPHFHVVHLPMPQKQHVIGG